MSTTPFDASAFMLSEQESTSIFEQNIVPAGFGGFEKNVATLLPPSPPSSDGGRKSPVAVLIVGPTGAETKEEEQDGPVIAHFIADTLTRFYRRRRPPKKRLRGATIRGSNPGQERQMPRGEEGGDRFWRESGMRQRMI
ncbi:zeta toxin family protein [Apiospora sp. TS-2023a]